MTRYWVHPRDKIFAKGYRFFSFAKNKGKNNGKNIIKSLSNKYSQELLDHAKNLQAIHLALLQNQSLKKQQSQLVIWLVMKLLIKLQNFQQIHNKII